MIKAVFFDLDDTLYDYYPVSNKALIEVYKVLKKEVKISKNNFLKILNSSKKEVRKELRHSPDSHDRVIYFQRLGEKLNLSLNTSLKLAETYQKSFIKNMKSRKNVPEVFKKLKEKGIKIVIVTNEVVEIQLKKLKKMEISKYVDYFVASENVGIDKPDKRIFLYALKKVKLLPREVLMIGDSETDDINGANRVGIKSVRFSKNIKVKSKADYIIDDLKKVLKIVKDLNH